MYVVGVFDYLYTLFIFYGLRISPVASAEFSLGSYSTNLLGKW